MDHINLTKSTKAPFARRFGFILHTNIILFEHNKDCNFNETGPHTGSSSSGGEMKRVFVLFIALLITFALVGCNVAPNVPRVTPYTTNGTYFNNIQGGAYGPPARGNNLNIDGT